MVEKVKYSMFTSLALLVTIKTLAVSSSISMQYYWIIPNDTTTCNPEGFKYEVCYTLHQFAERESIVGNITLHFATGKHFLSGGIVFKNITNAVVKGRTEIENRPEISCKGRNCFTFYNSSSIHIENVVFTDCFNEASPGGGAIYITKASVVTITQCFFIRNTAVAHTGGAVLVMSVGSVFVMQSTFINNSAVCHLPERNSSGLFDSNCLASGGAVFMNEIQSIFISESLFEGNTASFIVGAVGLVNCSSGVVNQTTFVRNGALGNGGGLTITDSYVQIFNSLFKQNTVGDDWLGGGVWLTFSLVYISKSTFEENYSYQGGGVYAYDSNVNISKCSFFMNTANLSGGANCFEFSTFFINDTTYGNNKARFGGAISVHKYSNVNISKCSFFMNTADHSGGANYFEFSTFFINDTTYSNNKARFGGAISVPLVNNKQISASVSNSIFHSNTAILMGGAANFGDAAFSIKNILFQNNIAYRGGAIYALTAKKNIIINILNCRFLANVNNYKGASHGYGGALYIGLNWEPHCTVNCQEEVAPIGYEPRANIEGSTFHSNSGEHGGAIYVFWGVVRIINCVFSNNRVDKAGGAVYISGQFAYLWSNNFTNNTALEVGGALCIVGVILDSHHNVVTSSRHTRFAGAVTATSSTLLFKDDLYTDNWADINSGAKLISNSTVIEIECTYSYNKAFGSGGAMMITGSTFTSVNSTYHNNYARLTGAALEIAGSFVNIDGTSFYQNKVSNRTLKKDFQLTLLNNVSLTFDKDLFTKNDQAYTIHMTNVQGNYNNVLFTKNFGSMHLLSCTLSFSGSLIFKDASGITGGALSLVQSTLTLRKDSQTTIIGNKALIYGGGIFLSQSEIKVYADLLRIENNTAQLTGGGIYGYQSKITTNTRSDANSIWLINNSAKQDGGAFYFVASSLYIYSGSVTFARNKAQNGGAVALFEGSKIYILKRTEEAFRDEHTIKLIFLNNSAKYGGAVYVGDYTNVGVLCQPSNRIERRSISGEECFIQTLALYYTKSILDGNKVILRINERLNYVNIFFKFNIARASGNDIYGGLLDRCKMNAFSQLHNYIGNKNDYTGFNYLKIIAEFQIDYNYSRQTPLLNPEIVTSEITGDHVRALISSDPVQLCFCVNENYNCSYNWPTVFAKRGELFSIKAVTVDQVENPVTGTVLVNVISNNTRVNANQVRQTTNAVCTKLVYNVFSVEPNANVLVYPDGPCDFSRLSSKLLRINFLPCDCPAGLQPAPLDNECRCECASSVERYLSSCKLTGNSITVVRKKKNIWIQYTETISVAGFQFQSCPYDYCLDKPTNLSISLPLKVNKQCAFNRSGVMCGECEEGLSLVFGSSRCVHCSNNFLALLIGFAVAGVVLVVFILVLNITVAVGTIHGLILYTNIVGANSPTFLPPNSALHFFISWGNLDLGIETCFYNGMDSNAKVLLQLVFPAYIFLLAAIIIFVSHYWGWFAGLIGRKNPVATLCTLFLLSYSKLLRTIIASLQYTYLPFPDGSNRVLWNYNPNISYSTPSRTPFFLISVIILFLGTTYTMLLFFGQWLRKIGRKKFPKFFQSTQYNAFIDAYHAPYVFKHRYWIGILLFTRIIHHLLSSVLDKSMHPLIVSCLMCVLLFIKIVIGKVYRNWLIGLMETSFIFNLLLFSVSTYYVSNTDGDQVAVAYTSSVTVFISFTGIVLYHIYTYLVKNTRTHRNLGTSLKKYVHLLTQKLNIKNRENGNMSNDNENETNQLPLQERLLLREPILDDIAPLSAQDYSPPVVPSASAIPRPSPVTSTVVCINKTLVNSHGD